MKCGSSESRDLLQLFQNYGFKQVVSTAGFWLEGWKVMTSTIWQCEQLRAGQIYNKVLFHSKGDAETFVQQMRRVEPDMLWTMAAVPANTVWN